MLLLASSCSRVVIERAEEPVPRMFLMKGTKQLRLCIHNPLTVKTPRRLISIMLLYRIKIPREPRYSSGPLMLLLWSASFLSPDLVKISMVDTIQMSSRHLRLNRRMIISCLSRTNLREEAKSSNRLKMRMLSSLNGRPRTISKKWLL